VLEGGAVEGDRFGDVDFEDEVELVLVIEGTDLAGLGADAVGLGPELVVGVLGELAEAEVAAFVGDVGLDGVGAGILQIDDRSSDGAAILIYDPAGSDALLGNVLLGLRREGGCKGRSEQDGAGGDRQQGEKQVAAGN